MAENKNILDRISPFSLLLTLVILMVIGAALIPLVDVGSSPKPRQGKTLTISYSWRNASPKVVEQEVTSKIEGLVSAVKGVGEVSSVSNFGSGRVTVVLKKEADVSAVKFEISSLLKQVRKKLPEDVSYPVLSGGEVVNEGGGERENTLRHLLTYQVNSNLKGEQIKEYVQKNVEPVVRAWDEVKRVDVTGGTSQDGGRCGRWHTQFHREVRHRGRRDGGGRGRRGESCHPLPEDLALCPSDWRDAPEDGGR